MNKHQKLFKDLIDDKKWLLISFQKGEGCDYSIGCGYSMRFVDIDETKSIIEQSRSFLEDFGNAEKISDGVYRVLPANSDTVIEFMLIIKIDKYSLINVDGLRKEDASFWVKKKEEAKNAVELAEFERLKAKFGKS